MMILRTGIRLPNVTMAGAAIRPLAAAPRRNERLSMGILRAGIAAGQSNPLLAQH
jgi:hypothetical protein